MKPSTALLLFGGIGAALLFGSKAQASTGGMTRAERLIKNTESLSLTPYQDAGGTWHIGYGHSLPGKPQQGKITRYEAEQLLRADLRTAAQAVDRLVDVSLTPTQRAALISFTYNLGAGALSRSTLLRKLNQGDYQGAANEFPRWIYVDGEQNKGLRTRRMAEKQVFEYSL